MRNFILLILLWCFPVILFARDTVTVNVNGKPLTVNGTGEVPAGLFGVHAGNFSFNSATVNNWGIESARTIQHVPDGNPIDPGEGFPAELDFVVNCWYDRFQPALQLTNSSWKTDLRNQAENFATASNTEGYSRHLEFWNEPFLNWAYKPGVNTDPHYYQKTGVQEGDPVYVKGESSPEPYLIWKNAQWYESPYWAANRIEIYNYISYAWNNEIFNGGCAYPCMDALEMGKTYYEGSDDHEFTVIDTLRPVDTTQEHYYAARQDEHFYSEMFGVVGNRVDSLNPDANVIAGWGFEVHKDHWAPWYTLFKPMIDKHIDVMDGIYEHHYGMDTRLITADYETVASYVQTRYDKHLDFYNTETGGYLDPQRPESVSNSPGSVTPAQKALNAFTYNYRDIIYMMDKSPDKAYSRAVHEPQKTNGGVEAAFKVLKTLRGDLYYAETDDEDVYAVSSYNGSEYTVACFNNASSSKQTDLNITAPNGLQFDSVTIKTVDTIADTLVVQTNQQELNQTEWSASAAFSPYEARVYIFSTSGGLSSPMDTVQMNQYFADSILMNIPAGESVSMQINLPSGQLAEAKDVRLKYVLMNYGGNGFLSINGNPYPIVNYCGGDPSKNLGGITYQKLNVAHLQSSNTLTIHAGDSACQLWMASMELINAQLPGEPKLSDISLGSRPSNENIKLVPNPAREQVKIMGMNADKWEIEIYDLKGSQIYHSTSPANNTVNLSHLSAGMYVVNVQTENKTIRRKLIIRHEY